MSANLLPSPHTPIIIFSRLPSFVTGSEAPGFPRNCDKQRILDAMRLTFERRGTHDLPANLVPPPADWQVPFHALAGECRLPTDVAAVFAGVQKFVEEVLAQRTER